MIWLLKPTTRTILGSPKNSDWKWKGIRKTIIRSICGFGKENVSDFQTLRYSAENTLSKTLKLQRTQTFILVQTGDLHTTLLHLCAVLLSVTICILICARVRLVVTWKIHLHYSTKFKEVVSIRFMQIVRDRKQSHLCVVSTTMLLQPKSGMVA